MERGQPNNQLMDMLKLLQINMAMKNKQEQERKKQRRSSYPSNKYQSRSGRNQTIPKNIIYQNAQYTFDKNEYLNLRNSLFTKSIEKIKILIDSKNIDHTSSHNTSNYTVYFDGSGRSNQTGGFGTYNNVIGFRLLKAIIPNSSHQVNDSNNTLIVNGGTNTITLAKGSYSTYTLAAELQAKLISVLGVGYTVTYINVTQKYEIKHSSSAFIINWNTSFSGAYRLFGFLNMDSVSQVEHISDNSVDFSGHYVDLVVPEIPYIACKHNGRGAAIIERIPLDVNAGSLLSYSTHSSEVYTQNYFYPMKLSSINIQLHEDTEGVLYDAQNADNSFEFEITILKNTELVDKW